MPDPMHAKLGPYLDGELLGAELAKMEAHLAACPRCRAELASLRRLSQRLHAAPFPAFTPAQRFSNRLMLQLPRRAENASPRAKAMSPLGWGWLFPATLLAAWFFLRVALTLTSLLGLSWQAGLWGEAATWLGSTPSSAGWWAATELILGSALGAEILSQVGQFNQISQIGQNLLAPLGWQAGLVILYWLWLSLWWPQHKQALQAIRS